MRQKENCKRLEANWSPLEAYDERHAAYRKDVMKQHIQMRQSATRNKQLTDHCAEAVRQSSDAPFPTNLCIRSVTFYVAQSRSKRRSCKQFVD